MELLCQQITRQSGSWMPRLERMIQLRNLSTFEKNIILYLIGSVIQSNKVSSTPILYLLQQLIFKHESLQCIDLPL